MALKAKNIKEEIIQKMKAKRSRKLNKKRCKTLKLEE